MGPPIVHWLIYYKNIESFILFCGHFGIGKYKSSMEADKIAWGYNLADYQNIRLNIPATS